MVEKIYWALWILLALVAVGLYVVGLLTPLMTVVLGFITFGLIYLGMIGILPEWVGHQTKPNH